MKDIDLKNLAHLTGQRKKISTGKLNEKLHALKTGNIKMNPGVEDAYKQHYGDQYGTQQAAVDQYTQNIQTPSHSEGDYGLLRNPPSGRNQQPAEANYVAEAGTIQTPQLKLGTLFSFDKQGKLQVKRDAKGFEYSFDNISVANLEFAKGESVPERLKRKFNASQLYTVADVTIDLTEIADTFEEGDSIDFEVTEVKSYYQRFLTNELCKSVTVEADLKTDIDVTIPAKVTLKAHPLALDLLSWTLKEVQASAQVNEILEIIDS